MQQINMYLSSVCALQKHLPAPLCLPHCLQDRVAGQDGIPTESDIEAAVVLMEPYFQSGNYPTVRIWHCVNPA